jgi:hypothetical protein
MASQVVAGGSTVMDSPPKLTFASFAKRWSDHARASPRNDLRRNGNGSERLRVSPRRCRGSDFLALQAVIPFLQTARDALVRIDTESSDRFKCVLRPRRISPNIIERRFPLHEQNRVLRIKIPLINDGPGVAVDTTAHVVAGTDLVVIGSELTDIGAVPPGEFALFFEMLVGEPVKEVPLMVELRWRTARGAEPLSASFEATLYAQKPDINWEALKTSDPYSTEIAYGEEFVGRDNKVLALANRVLKSRMQSSYITGQKRVGKTSLTMSS